MGDHYILERYLSHSLETEELSFNDEADAEVDGVMMRGTEQFTEKVPQWTVEEVCDWLKTIGFGEFCDVFKILARANKMLVGDCDLIRLMNLIIGDGQIFKYVKILNAFDKVSMVTFSIGFSSILLLKSSFSATNTIFPLICM